MLWGGTVNLLELVASFPTLATICSYKEKIRFHITCKHTAQENIADGAAPPRSPSVKILRKDSELQSTPL